MFKKDKIVDIITGSQRVRSKKSPREKTMTWCFLSIPDKEKFLSLNKTFNRLYDSCYDYEIALLKRPLLTSDVKRAQKWGDRLILDNIGRLRLIEFLKHPTSRTCSIRCSDGCSIIDIDYLQEDDMFEFSQYMMTCSSNSRVFANFVDLQRNQITTILDILKD